MLGLGLYIRPRFSALASAWAECGRTRHWVGAGFGLGIRLRTLFVPWLFVIAFRTAYGASDQRAMDFHKFLLGGLPFIAFVYAHLPDPVRLLLKSERS